MNESLEKHLLSEKVTKNNKCVQVFKRKFHSDDATYNCNICDSGIITGQDELIEHR